MKLPLRLSLAALLYASFISTGPVAAQTGDPTAAKGVAIADLEQAVARSASYSAAVAQIKTSFATQIAQADSRSKALTAELQPLVSTYQTAAKAPNANSAALAKQLADLQKREQAAREEIARLSEPFNRANAYAQEQIATKLEAAVNSAMIKRQMAVLLQPQAAIRVLASADITGDISTELNLLVPTVSIAAPAGWQPGQTRDTRAPGEVPGR